MASRFTPAPIFLADGSVNPETIPSLADCRPTPRYMIRFGHEHDGIGLAHTIYIVFDREERVELATYRGDLGAANAQARSDAEAHVARLNG